MRVIKQSDINEIVLAFLQGEIESKRFSAELTDALTKLNLDESLILKPDLNNEIENELRAKVLGEFRGYGKNEDLFENFPVVEECVLMEANFEDLNNIRYMNYSYWNELSNNTSNCLVAAKNIVNGKIVYDVSNQPFLSGVEFLKAGNKFKPLILFTADYQTYVVLEGHSRLTVYGLAPEHFKNVECYVIKCSKEDLKKWNGEL